MKALHSPDGRLLATIGTFVVGERSITLRPASQPGPLLRYHFLEGGRQVRLFLDGTRIDGSLRTRWTAGRRIWEFTPTRQAHGAPTYGDRLQLTVGALTVSNATPATVEVPIS